MHGMCMPTKSLLAALATTLAQVMQQHSLAHVRTADLRIEAVTVLLDAARALALASTQVGGTHDLFGGIAASTQAHRHTGTHAVLVHVTLRIKPHILTARRGYES
jgi:predicted metal-binding protein